MSSLSKCRAAVLLVLLVATSACASPDDDDATTTTALASTTSTTTSTTLAETTTTTSTPVPAILGEKPEVSLHTEPAPTELVINDLVVGDGDEATAGSTVVAEYVGVRYRDGVQFDSSWDRGQPFEFVLGFDGVIQGWHLGFEGMRVGGRRELIIPPDLAYGENGAGADIGPGETLIFVVDLIDLRSAFSDPQIDSPERVVLPNQGGAFEGATLWLAEGAGSSLIIGDESNPNLPAGEGLQIYLTFDLSSATNLAGASVTSAHLRSRAMQQVDGTPFDDLGVLTAAPVIYESFPPTGEERTPIGDAVECEADPEAVQLSCDVAEGVGAAIEAGAERVSFRLRFAEATDSDGEPDFALFFISEPGLNEPGVFTLELALS
ncbi:MAG: hypothetical protein GY708_21585 [Actinomycetia bacterium]|nr:hypothetical protein [Actinomycetes bacterium]MCP4963563.1 hypothetical protein [Actinomycetes bacterium]